MCNFPEAAELCQGGYLAPSTASTPLHPGDGLHSPQLTLCHTFSWKLTQGEVILILEGDIRPSLKDLGSGYATFLLFEETSPSWLSQLCGRDLSHHTAARVHSAGLTALTGAVLLRGQRPAAPLRDLPQWVSFVAGTADHGTPGEGGEHHREAHRKTLCAPKLATRPGWFSCLLPKCKIGRE